MGWPRKDDDMRLYRERDGAYLVVIVANGTNGAGCYDAIGNAFKGPAPTLASTSASVGYLRQLRRASWGELPQEWKDAIRRWLDNDQTPESVRGFWRIGEQPREWNAAEWLQWRAQVNAVIMAERGERCDRPTWDELEPYYRTHYAPAVAAAEWMKAFPLR